MRVSTSSASFDKFREGLRKETGSTDVVHLTVYPLYAVVELVTDPAKGRTKSLYHDGGFSDSGPGTMTDKPFDLSGIDGDKMAGLSRKVRKMVEDPNQWCNEYGEGAYISATPDGKVVSRVTW